MPRLLVGFGVLSACLAAGYGVLFTVIDDYVDEYGISTSGAGLIIGIGFIAGFLAQVVLGPLADHGHARALVVAGVLVNVAGLTLLAFGTALIPLLVGRFVSGVGIGAAGPAVRRIVIVAAPDDLGRNLGRLLSADVFGFAVGPAISAALVGPFGIAAPFLVIAAATVLLLPLLVGVDARETRTGGPRLALDLLRDRGFAGAIVLGGGAFVMIGAFDALWSIVHDDLGTAEWVANLGITLFALPLVVLGPPGGRLAQTIGPFRIGAAGLAFGAAFMFGYGVLPTGMAIFALAMAHAVSDGLTIASTGVAVGMVVDVRRQAGAQGVLGAAQAALAGVMAPITGWVYHDFGRTAAYTVSAITMLVVVAVAYALARPVWSIARRA